MIQQEINLESIANNVGLDSGYFDDDIVILDNVKEFVEPDVVRMGMNAIVLCTAGKATGIMNNMPMEMKQNQVVMLPPGVTCTDLMISPDFEFKALFLTNRILQSFLRDKIDIWNDVMYIQRQHVFSMEQDDNIRYFSHFYELIMLCIENRSGNPFQSDIIQSLLRSAILAICGEIKLRNESADGKPLTVVDAPINQQAASSSNHFRHFLDLLNSGPIRHRSVDSYATELCITPKYLSTVCKKNSGKTANEWITERVMQEITYYLTESELSIKQISACLGFPNPSFFGRYVKERTGMTPLQLRQKNSSVG